LRVLVAVDEIAVDAVVIDEWGLDNLGTGDHHGPLDIDRLFNDESCLMIRAKQASLSPR
jgi:hypothetical protein